MAHEHGVQRRIRHVRAIVFVNALGFPRPPPKKKKTKMEGRREKKRKKDGTFVFLFLRKGV